MADKARLVSLEAGIELFSHGLNPPFDETLAAYYRRSIAGSSSRTFFSSFLKGAFPLLRGGQRQVRIRVLPSSTLQFPGHKGVVHF